MKREDLGHLSVGAPADVAVLSLQAGKFGFIDSFGGRLRADKKLVCEMTLRDGRILYDLNGLARPDWETLPKGYRTTGDARWDAITGGNDGEDEAQGVPGRGLGRRWRRRSRRRRPGPGHAASR